MRRKKAAKPKLEDSRENISQRNNDSPYKDKRSVLERKVDEANNRNGNDIRPHKRNTPR